MGRAGTGDPGEGASWGHLGASWGPLGDLLVALGASWGSLEGGFGVSVPAVDIPLGGQWYPSTSCLLYRPGGAEYVWVHFSLVAAGDKHFVLVGGFSGPLCFLWLRAPQVPLVL